MAIKHVSRTHDDTTTKKMNHIWFAIVRTTAERIARKIDPKWSLWWCRTSYISRKKSTRDIHISHHSLCFAPLTISHERWSSFRLNLFFKKLNHELGSEHQDQPANNYNAFCKWTKLARKWIERGNYKQTHTDTTQLFGRDLIYDTHTQNSVRSMYVVNTLYTPIRNGSGTKFIVRVMR